MKKSTVPSAKAAKSGVDQIIDHLVKHRDEIGAIAVSLCAKPDGKATHPDGDKVDGYCLIADNVLGDAESKAAVTVRTVLTKGLVADIHTHVLKPKPAFPFG